MNSREVVLGKVRAALAREVSERAHDHDARAELPMERTSRGSTQAIDRPALVRAFCERLEESGGRVRLVGDEGEAAASFAELVRELGVERLAISDAASLAPLISAVDELECIVPQPHAVGPEQRAPLLTACAGLTSAQLGIAETGTLVLNSAVELHRLASLVPPIHIALLRSADIVAELGDGLEHLAGVGLPATLSFITGPSRTADIELELVVGVHGPRELHVILLAD